MSNYYTFGDMLREYRHALAKKLGLAKDEPSESGSSGDESSGGFDGGGDSYSTSSRQCGGGSIEFDPPAESSDAFTCVFGKDD
jgi:hypothetical protein